MNFDTYINATTEKMKIGNISIPLGSFLSPVPGPVALPPLDLCVKVHTGTSVLMTQSSVLAGHTVPWTAALNTTGAPGEDAATCLGL